MTIFRERLLELLEESDLSFKDISQNAGVSKASLSLWSRFDIVPNTRSIIKLAVFFNCSVDYLLGRTANPTATFSGTLSNALSIDNTLILFLQRLASLIKEKNITSYRVCKELHIDTAMMSDWTNNGTLPSCDNLLLLADYFNTSTDFLLGLSDNK